MPNPKLTPREIEEEFRPLISKVRQLIEKAAKGDSNKRFALRRKLYKDLSYDERTSPSARKALKARKRKAQGNICPRCSKPLSEKGNVLDRRSAIGGYTDDNTDLIHHDCDSKMQASRGYRDV